MKVYVCTDLEGVAGIVSTDEQCVATGKYYEQAKRWLTAEINAAVEGMFEEGVTDALILDGHGPGAISYEDLHPKATLLHGRPTSPREWRNAVVNEYDVAMMIGQHAMAGTRDGVLNHTQNSRTVEYYKLNGTPIGEIAQFALHCGAMGIPMIFLSGDEAACREVRELIPAVTAVSVKRGLSRFSAISLASAEAHRVIREGVREAIRNHREQPIKPVVWKGPFVLEKRFFHSEVGDAYDGNPIATRLDAKTVRLTGDDIAELIYA